MKFQLGIYDEDITPIRNSLKAEEHYAWCIQDAIRVLNSNLPPSIKYKTALDNFQTNMLAHPITQEMLAEVANITDMSSYRHFKLSEETIKNLVCGFCVGEKGYMYVTEDKLDDILPIGHLKL